MAHGSDDHDHDHDRGLAFDVQTLIDRRRALFLFAGVGATALVGCTVQNGGTTGSTTTTSTSSSPTPTATSSTPAEATAAATSGTGAAAVDCAEEIPEETAGPFPGDGSNGPNVLTESGIVRSDIRSSFGTSTTTAEGVPLTVKLALQDDANGCAPLAGAAVYLWHCNRDGQYSLYSQGVTDQNYLRGVQESDASGNVTFTSIFPAAYSGRWPHIHFEVYESLATATSAGPIKATSQLALPEDVCDLVYATDGYDASVRNLSQSSLQTDNVFRDDGGVHQLATVTGDVETGFVASLNVPV